MVDKAGLANAYNSVPQGTATSLTETLSIIASIKGTINAIQEKCSRILTNVVKEETTNKVPSSECQLKEQLKEIESRLTNLYKRIDL